MADEKENKPTVTTKVKLGNQEVELKNMPTATGLEIYRALPADYQKQAAQISEVVTVFGSFLEVSQKYNLDPTVLAQKWVNKAMNTEAVKTAKMTFSDIEEKAFNELKALNIDPKAIIRMIPGGETVVGAANVAAGVGTVVGTAASVAGAGIDGAVNGLPRMWNLLATMAKEGKGLVFGYGSGAPKDDALAFGAAVMAVRYQSVQERHQKPIVDMPFNGKESQLEANPPAVALAGWDAFKQYIMKEWPLVAAVCTWLFDWSDKKPSWEQIKANAYAESQALKNGKAVSFQQQIDTRSIPADNAHAKSVLEAAEQVAGLNARALAGVATASTGPDRFGYTDTSGNDIVVENGNVVSKVTPLDRLVSAGAAIVGDGPLWEQAARGSGAAWVAYQAPRGIAEGVASQVSNNPAASARDFVRTAATKLKDINAAADMPKASFVWNAPRGIGRALGDGITKLGILSKDLVVGAKNIVVGGVEGVHALVNGVDVGKAASKAEAIGIVAGKATVVATAAVAPVVATTKTFADIGKGENVSAALHAVETGVLGTMALKGGLKAGLSRVPGVQPVMSVTEGVIAAKEGNMIGVKKAGVELGTIGAFAAAGAGWGLIGGPLAPATVPAGAGVGALIGGVVSLFSGRMYENHAKGKALIADADTPPTGALPADPNLAAVAALETQRAEERIAQIAAASKPEFDKARAAVKRAQFACVGSNKLGALCTENLPLAHTNAAEQMMPLGA